LAGAGQATRRSARLSSHPGRALDGPRHVQSAAFGERLVWKRAYRTPATSPNHRCPRTTVSTSAGRSAGRTRQASAPGEAWGVQVDEGTEDHAAEDTMHGAGEQAPPGEVVVACDGGGERRVEKHDCEQHVAEPADETPPPHQHGRRRCRQRRQGAAPAATGYDVRPGSVRRPLEAGVWQPGRRTLDLRVSARHREGFTMRLICWANSSSGAAATRVRSASCRRSASGWSRRAGGAG
jgi:hypothetical protein